MKIQVLGSGCATCHKLYEITKKAVLEMGLGEEVEYLSGDEGVRALIKIGSMSSPVLAVDGKIAMSGFTPDVEKIKKYIKGSLKSKKKPSQCDCGKGDCC